MKNQNNIARIIFVSCIVVIASCAKKKNTKLARDYYKLALLELSARQPNDPSDGASDQLSYKKALGYINQALEQDKQARYLAAKATLLFLLGQEVAGGASFQEALTLCHNDEPLRAEILNNYACVCAQQNKPETALKIWRELETNQYYLTPEVSLVNQGKLYADQGDFVAAKNCLLRAVALSPSYIDAHYYTALVAQRLGDIPLATNELKTLLFLEPHHDGATRLMTHIDTNKPKLNMRV